MDKARDSIVRQTKLPSLQSCTNLLTPQIDLYLYVLMRVSHTFVVEIGSHV